MPKLADKQHHTSVSDGNCSAKSLILLAHPEHHCSRYLKWKGTGRQWNVTLLKNLYLYFVLLYFIKKSSINFG
jgi:hypothetical protein